QLALYPASVQTGAEDAILLLSKVLQLIGALGLNEREVRYLLTHADDFGKPKFDDLPVRPVGESNDEQQAATARFGWFLRLASYVRTKRDLAGGTDDLIDVFEANGTTAPARLDDAVYPLLARLTRRDVDTVKATARALSPAPGFASEQPLQRLWQALQ